jgi:integrase
MTKTKRRRPWGDGGLREIAADVWEIKYEIGKDPKTGKRRTRYATVHGSCADARKALTEHKQQRNDGTLPEPSTITVAEHLEEWLTRAAVNVSPKTHERYSELVRLHLKPAIGALPLRDLSTAHLRDYYHKARTTPRTVMLNDKPIERKPLSARTVKHIHGVLKQALEQAFDDNKIAKNPAKVKRLCPRPEDAEMKILDPAQMAALLKLAEASAIYMPVLLAATTGMRRGEVLALRWRDIDLPARALKVTQSLEETKAGLRFKKPKTRHSLRTIPLGQLTVDALKTHRARQAKGRLGLGRLYADNDLVCANELGAPLFPHLITDAFTDLVAKTGVRIRFHDLRHSHISHLLALGVNIKAISVRAGHKNPSVTLNIYSHCLPGAEEDAAARADAALQAQMERAIGGN